jgi:hypothetical protein
MLTISVFFLVIVFWPDPPPTVDIVKQVDGSSNEGERFNRIIKFTDGRDDGSDGHTVKIDWDGDNNYDQSFVTKTYSFEISHKFPDGDSINKVSVTVFDDDKEKDTEFFSVEVNNVRPQVTITGPDILDEGEEGTFEIGEISDPGDDNTIEALIQWDEFHTTPYYGAGNYTHSYPDNSDSNAIAVIVIDEDGAFTAAIHPVSVRDVAPTITLDGDASVYEGKPYLLALQSPIDPGDDEVSEYLIDWGDNSQKQLVKKVGIIQHTFKDGDSTVRISVDIVNEDGTFSGGTLDVKVLTVQPSLGIEGKPTAIKNMTYVLTLDEIKDLGDDELAINGITIDWGDGKTDRRNNVGEISHTYQELGNYTITVSLEDEDNKYPNIASLTVEVSEPTSTIDIQSLNDDSVTQNVRYETEVNFTDSNRDEESEYTVEIDWTGDGKNIETLTITETSFHISHVFTEPDKSFIISVKITNQDGQSDTENFTIIVNDTE